MNFLSKGLPESHAIEIVVEKKRVGWATGLKLGPRSDEVKQKIRDANIGKKVPAWVIEKVSKKTKGKKKTTEHCQKIADSLTVLIFEGKTVKDWSNILGGDQGEIRKHIKNGTMLKYSAYRRYIGLDSIRNKHQVKKIMTPKGIMTYKEAKTAFGWSQAETIRNRVRSDRYPEWYEILPK